MAPRFSGGYTVRMTTWAAESRIPLPQAWITRPAIITPKFPAKMLSSSPTRKLAIPAMYSRLVGKRVMRKAVRGMTTPMARE